MCEHNVDKQLHSRMEEWNILDLQLYPVAIVQSGNIVGHMLLWIVAACNLFIQKGVLLYVC